METQNARDALTAVRRSEAAFSNIARWPLSRHAAFGLIQAMGVVAIGVPSELTGFLIAAVGVAVFLIIRGDRNRDGFFVHGYSSKRAAPALILAAIVSGAGIVVLVLTDALFRWSLIAPAVAAAVFVGSTLASLWWEKLYRSELREAAKS